MKVYIIRHGKAHDESESGLDRDRVLRNKGHRQAKALGLFLKGRDEQPELVLSSPYTRTMETSRSIWDALDQ